MHKMKYNSHKNNNRNQQSISNCTPSVQFTVKKKKYSNETKLFSSINFIVLGSWLDNKINNDMLALLYTSN
jgi:hypothetical protein